MTDTTNPTTKIDVGPSTTVVFNPASGSAPDENEIRNALGADVKVSPTTEEDPGTGQAEQAVANGATLVIASGGDGTVRAILDPLAGTDTVLGIIPSGTGNLLASSLGIPTGLDATDGLTDRTVRRIDLGRANGEAFANMAGIGFDADMMVDAPGSWKERIGTSAYVFSALRHLRDPLTSTTVEIDGRPWFAGRSAMVLVGNFGTISGGVEIFPDASPDDGRLDVLVLSTSTLSDWVRVAWRIVRGKGLGSVAAERSTGREISVTTRTPRRWEIDGEERPPTTQVTFTVEPQAISVLGQKD